MKFYKFDEILWNKIFKFNYNERGNLIFERELNGKEIKEIENTKENNI